MQNTRAILAAFALSAVALAQTAAPAQPAKPGTTTLKPVPATTMRPAPVRSGVVAPAKPAPQAVKIQPAPVKAAPVAKKAEPVKPAAAAKAEPKKAPAKVEVAKVKVDAAKPSPAKDEPKKVSRNIGRRDPFVSPIKVQEDLSKSASCSTGPRCLAIDQVVLKGTVKTQSGMIAMVENSARKQYNLRENDAVLNGTVTKITVDAVVFRMNTTDNLGRPVSREVVKRVTVPTA